MNTRLIHDAAFAGTIMILQHLPLLSEEERRQAFGLWYEVIKDVIEAYELNLIRMLERLHPGKN